jgi:hypothetical protein
VRVVIGNRLSAATAAAAAVFLARGVFERNAVPASPCIGRLPRTQIAPRILMAVVVVKGVRAILSAMAPINFDDSTSSPPRLSAVHA